MALVEREKQISEIVFKKWKLELVSPFLCGLLLSLKTQEVGVTFCAPLPP